MHYDCKYIHCNLMCLCVYNFIFCLPVLFQKVSYCVCSQSVITLCNTHHLSSSVQIILLSHTHTHNVQCQLLKCDHKVMHVFHGTSMVQTIRLHAQHQLHDYMCKGVLCGLSACIEDIMYCIHPYTGMECVQNTHTHIHLLLVTYALYTHNHCFHTYVTNCAYTWLVAVRLMVASRAVIQPSCADYATYIAS